MTCSGCIFQFFAIVNIVVGVGIILFLSSKNLEVSLKMHIAVDISKTVQHRNSSKVKLGLFYIKILNLFA